MSEHDNDQSIASHHRQADIEQNSEQTDFVANVHNGGNPVDPGTPPPSCSRDLIQIGCMLPILLLLVFGMIFLLTEYLKTPKLKSEIKSLKSQVQSKEDQLDNLKITISHLQGQLGTCEAAIDQSTKEKDELANRIQALEVQDTQKSSQIVLLHEANQQCSTQNSRFNATLLICKDHVMRLNASVVALDHENTILVEQNQAFMGLTTDLNRTLDGMDRNNTLLTVKLGELQNTNQLLDATIDALSNQTMGLLDANDNLNQTIIQLHTKASAFQRQLETLSLEAASLVDTNLNLQQSLNNLTFQSVALQSELMACKQQNTALNSSVIQLSHGLQQTIGELDVCEIQTHNLTTTLGACTKLTNSLKEIVGSRETEISLLEDLNDGLVQDNQGLWGTIVALRNQTLDLTAQNMGLNQTVQDLEQHVTSLHDALDQRDQSLWKLGNQLDRYTMLTIGLNETIQQYARQNEILNASLHLSKEQNHALNATVVTLIDQNGDLSDQIHGFSSLNQGLNVTIQNMIVMLEACWKDWFWRPRTCSFPSHLPNLSNHHRRILGQSSVTRKTFFFTGNGHFMMESVGRSQPASKVNGNIFARFWVLDT